MTKIDMKKMAARLLTSRGTTSAAFRALTREMYRSNALSLPVFHTCRKRCQSATGLKSVAHVNIQCRDMAIVGLIVMSSIHRVSSSMK